MNVTHQLALCTLCILNTGCTLSDNLLRTSVIQPVKYNDYWDVFQERRRFRKLAEDHLERARMQARVESDIYSHPPFSIDYEDGFVVGFVDYLIYGGTGNPPPLPPRGYWWTGDHCRADCNAIEHWYQGFNHGAAVAEASGFRNCVTVPLSDTLLIDTRPVYMGEFHPQRSNAVGEPPAELEPLERPLGEPIEPPADEPSSPSDEAEEFEELPAPNSALADLFQVGPLESPQAMQMIDEQQLRPHRLPTPVLPTPVLSPPALSPPALSPPKNVPLPPDSLPPLIDGLLESPRAAWLPGKSRSPTSADSIAAFKLLPLLLLGLVFTPTSGRNRHRAIRKPARWFSLLVVVCCCLMGGCASLTNPVLNGIPVRKIPEELLSQPRRDQMQTVPLALFRQDQPEEYLLAAGDVVGVYIAGVFPPTTADQPIAPPPVNFPSQIDPVGAGLPPSLGYPVTIRNDGTLSLPLIEPISVDGLSVEQVNERVEEAYSTSGILQPGRESVLITLMQPRQVRVAIFRQEVGGFAAGGRGDISSNNLKRGTGFVIDLRAYENDILNALAQTGGLPGLDSYSGVYIFRGGQTNSALTQHLQTLGPGSDVSLLSEFAVETDYIPIRWPVGQPLPFQPEDIILNEGDVMLLEARTEDLFYTAGLLPAGERVLPRDYDLDVVEAVVQVSGTLVNGAFGGNNFNGLLIQKGLGNPNPSALTVIRRTPGGGQVPIRVDLNRALVDARERILVQPGDVLILQETRQEAVARYFGTLLNFNLFWQTFQRGDATGAAAITQLPSI